MGVGVGAPGAVVAVGRVGAVGVGSPEVAEGVVVRVEVVVAVDVALLRPQATRVAATAMRASARRTDSGMDHIGSHLSRTVDGGCMKHAPDIRHVVPT